MRRFLARLIICCIAAALPLHAQQTSESFRWIDFHSQSDENIVTWVTRSLTVANWTAIREIGVMYDAALVVTENRKNGEATPGAEQFMVWNVSLTNHAATPLITGVNLRWFDRARFADGGDEEWPVLYDNCRECAATTYLTAFYYDLRSHAWATRWITGGHGVPVWSDGRPAGVDWTQVYALLGGVAGHVTLYTWNHIEHPSPKQDEDFISRYDLDPISGRERSLVLGRKEADAVKLELCRGQNAVEGLARGQDSPLCQDMLSEHKPRKPVTTPPANNRGRMASGGGRK